MKFVSVMIVLIGAVSLLRQPNLVGAAVPDGTCNVRVIFRVRVITCLTIVPYGLQTSFLTVTLSQRLTPILNLNPA